MSPLSFVLLDLMLQALTRRSSWQVLSVCSEHVQREILAFLPEVAVEEDYKAIVDAMEARAIRLSRSLF